MGGIGVRGLGGGMEKGKGPSLGRERRVSACCGWCGGGGMVDCWVIDLGAWENGRGSLTIEWEEES